MLTLHHTVAGILHPGPIKSLSEKKADQQKLTKSLWPSLFMVHLKSKTAQLFFWDAKKVQAKSEHLFRTIFIIIITITTTCELIEYSKAWQHKSRTPVLNDKSDNVVPCPVCTVASKGIAVLLVLLCLMLLVNNTRFPFPQQLSQLPQSTESEAGGWGGESYKEIRESLTSLGRSMGCFTRKMEED